MSCFFRPAVFGLALAVISAAQISAAAEPKPNPADPAADVAGLEYRSAFSDYKRPQFETVGDWRKINDLVHAVGGFAGALKEDAPAPDAAPPPPAASQPPAGGHSRHKH